MNALTTQNTQLAKPISPVLSPVLKTLLVQEPSTETACRLIATDPAMLAEVRAKLPELEAYARRPSGDDGVKRVVGPRLALFPTGQKSDGEWSAWWGDYFQILRSTPEPALEAGMVAWMQAGNRFMPAPGELLALAKSTVNGATRAFQRARGADEWQPPRTYEPVEFEAPTARGIPEPTKADREAVRRMADEFAAQKPTVKSGPALPTMIPPGLDEHGISPAMRAIMEARR